MDDSVVLLKCYRYSYKSNCDPELVWEFVERQGGFMTIRGDCIDFFVSSTWEALFLLAFGHELERRAIFDYVA